MAINRNHGIRQNVLNQIAQCKDINDVPHTELLGQTRDDWQLEIFMARMENAERHYRDAQVLFEQGSYFASIGRSYYAAYSALRGFLFLETGSDKQGDHSSLPNAIPNTLASSAKWANELAAMRINRNIGDYEAQPGSEDSARGQAGHCLVTVSQLLEACERCC